MFELKIFDKTKPYIHNYVTAVEAYCFSYIGNQKAELKWDYKNNHSITLNNHV